MPSSTVAIASPVTVELQPWGGTAWSSTSGQPLNFWASCTSA